MPKPLVSVLAVVSLVVVSAGVSQNASPLKYRQETVAAQDGKPVLQLTNMSALPITAYVVVRSRYEDPEVQGRSYRDSCVFGRVEKPIANGESTLESAGDQVGSHFEMVRTEVRAVVFEDGSTEGDSSWIDAILARRLRFCDRLRAYMICSNSRSELALCFRLSSITFTLRKRAPISNFRTTTCA